MTDVLSLFFPLLAAAGAVVGLWFLVGFTVSRGAPRRRALQLWAIVPAVLLATVAVVGYVLSLTGDGAAERAARAVEDWLSTAVWVVVIVAWLVVHAGLLLAGLRRSGAEKGLALAGSGLAVVADLLAFAMLWVFVAKALIEDGRLA
jgi:hypothetical protein